MVAMMTLVIRRFENSSVAVASGDDLLDGLEVIDATAESVGLPPLSEYADAREVPEDFDGDLTELTALLGENDVWHDSVAAVDHLDRLADALGNGEGAALAAAVRDLAQTLRAHPGRFQLDVLDSVD